MFYRVHIFLTVFALALLSCGGASAQTGPVPGETSVTPPPGNVAPVPGPPANWPANPNPNQPFTSPLGPMPNQPAAAVPPEPVIVGPVHVPSAYQQLPTSANDAESRIAELRCLLPVSRAKELQEPVYQLCQWLDDMVAAHTKLAGSFAKHESTKVQLEAERRAVEKFSHLKYEAQLLKADLLIQQQRYPEALGPLIEIVSAEPRTATGQAAYRRLKDIGFAEEVGSALGSKLHVQTPPAKAATAPPAKPATAPPAKPAAAPAAAKAIPRPALRPNRAPALRPATAIHTAPRIKPRAKTYRVLSAQSGPLWLSGSPSGAPR